MKFTKIRPELLFEPRDGLLFNYVNRYWEMTKDGCILFYEGHSPQCNRDENVVRSWANKYGRSCKFFENIFVPYDFDGMVCLDDIDSEIYEV